MSDEITIRLPDGSTRALASGTTAADLARDIGSRLAKAAVIAVVNGEERDLATPLADGDEVAIVTGDSAEGLFTIRHSTAHVLAQAVLDLFPGATFGIGPPVEDGFYYDFELPGGEAFVEDDLERVDARMREIIAESQPFVRDEMPADKAREVFAGHRFKLEIIDDASTDPMSATSASESVRTYENPPAEPKAAPPFAGYPGFIDLCRGPHVPTTGDHLGHFKLCASPARTGAATRRTRSSSASTARRGPRSRRWRSTSTGSRRPPSATTASSAWSSTSSASPRSSGAAWRSSTPRVGSCAG